MLPYSQKLKYKDVFEGVKTVAAISQIILAKDFPVVEFILYVALTGDLADVVGEFQIGETVTGGTSAATGEVYAVTENSITLVNVVGTFTVMGETITGGDSAASATISSPTAPDFTIKAFISNQSSIDGVDNPPDPSLPPSPDNDYSQVIYSDESGGVNYGTDTPYNPTDSGGNVSYAPKTFRLGTDGHPISGKWVFLEIGEVEGTVGGALIDADINLSNL